mgnify:CR=1 FL=1
MEMVENLEIYRNSHFPHELRSARPEGGNIANTITHRGGRGGLGSGKRALFTENAENHGKSYKNIIFIEFSEISWKIASFVVLDPPEPLEFLRDY